MVWVIGSAELGPDNHFSLLRNEVVVGPRLPSAARTT